MLVKFEDRNSHYDYLYEAELSIIPQKDSIVSIFDGEDWFIGIVREVVYTIYTKVDEYEAVVSLERKREH